MAVALRLAFHLVECVEVGKLHFLAFAFAHRLLIAALLTLFGGVLVLAPVG